VDTLLLQDKSGAVYSSARWGAQWGNGGRLCMTDNIAQSKCRNWCVLCTTSTSMTITSVADLGASLPVRAYMAAIFTNCTAIIVCKGFATRLHAPEGWTLHSPTYRRKTLDTDIIEMVRNFVYKSVCCTGTLQLKDDEQMDEAEEEITTDVVLYKTNKLSASDFDRLLADAAIRKSDGRATRFDKALLAAQPFLHKIRAARDEANEGGIYFISNEHSHQRYPDDFVDVQNLMGIFYNEVTGLMQEVTLGQALDNCMEKDKVFVFGGRAGSGKTRLSQALAVVFAVRYLLYMPVNGEEEITSDSEKFVERPPHDVYYLLCNHSDSLKDLKPHFRQHVPVIIDKLDPFVKSKDPLGMLKRMGEVQKRTSVHSRFRNCVFVEKQTKLITTQYVHWYEFLGCSSMIREGEANYEDKMAVMRRMIFFSVQRRLLCEERPPRFQPVDRAGVQRALSLEKRWRAGLAASSSSASS